MTKTRKSRRGRRKKAPSRARTPKNKVPLPVTSPSSSNSPTSPFKGFKEDALPKPVRLFESDLDEAKEDAFDRLMNNSDHRRDLYKNIRTYSNKNKGKDLIDDELKEFHDCKKRDDILQWLNNTQNAFGRLTQTQTVPLSNESAEISTVDMPSVSQQRVRRTRRSPRKLRARSLDIQITKNVPRGRSKRHSFSGISPKDNGAIEDVEVPIPAEDEVKIIDYMEEQYLDNIDQEMLQNEDQFLSNVDREMLQIEERKGGWERIKDTSKIVNKKQPKQLKITRISPEKKGTASVNNNLCYDHDILESYFMENMEKVMVPDVESPSQSSGDMFSVKNAYQVGKNLLKILNTIRENGGEQKLKECQHLLNELKPFIALCSAQPKTVGVQTESDVIHTSVQTDPPQNVDKNTQTSLEQVSKEVQTDQVSSVRGLENQESRDDAWDDEVDDTLFALGTEEFLKNERATNLPTQDSLLVVSPQANKGVKRPTPESPQPEPVSSKRPCAKFIPEDLSVAVLTCNESEQENSLIVVSSESDNPNTDDYLNNLVDRYESDTEKRQPPSKTKTQEQIEELENLIHKATKSKRSPPPPAARERNVSPLRHEDTPNSSYYGLDDSDYFKPGTEKTPKKSRRDLFDSKTNNLRRSPQSFSESMFVSGKNTTVVANRTLTEDNVDVDIDKEVQDIFKSEKVRILENVVVKCAKNDEVLTQNSDVDVVESTPQKKAHNFTKDREESRLDITLPPPLEFQDSEKAKPDAASSPPRRPLAVINKITSTPVSQRFDSEKLYLSPITHGGKPERATSKAALPRALGPIELAQQSKYSPLTVVNKSLTQNAVRRPVTPKQKSILNYVRPSQEDKRSSSFDGSFKQKPCIACSRVGRDQVMAISAMTNRKLASYSTSFTSRVTHLIVSVNERNCLKDHTIKYVSAVASGIWVLSFGWIEQCLKRNCLVPEDPYEALDVSGVPGPRESRLTRTTNPLLKGFKIHASGPFVSTTRQEVENVARLCGAKVVAQPEALLDKNGHICLIITETKSSQDDGIFEGWLEALGVVSVDIEWLSRSVGQYKLVSVRPFALCSDENLESLGYPPELTAEVSFSYSQQTFTTVSSNL